MATDRVTIEYKVTTIYGDDKPRTPANTLVQVDQVRKTERFSKTGASLGYPTRDVEKTFTVTPRQASELIAGLAEVLSWMAADSLRWATQLEELGATPVEI